MKNIQYSLTFGSLSRNTNCAFVALMMCVMAVQVMPIFGRPRSSGGHLKSSLDAFTRDTRIPALKSETSEKAKSFRDPYLKFRSVPPTELIAKESANRILECEAGGSPTPTIHWLKNDKRIVQSDSLRMTEDEDAIKRGALSLSFTRSRLYLDCVQPKDAGMYSCVASSPYNRISADTHLKVIPNLSADADNSNYGDNAVALCLSKKSFGYPARIYMWTHNKLEMIGSDAQLICRSNGSPHPSTTWLGPEENQLANSEKYQILDTGDLLIRDLSWDDMGNYYCITENSHGSDRTSIFLYPTLPE